jgi:hypothetical protein
MGLERLADAAATVLDLTGIAILVLGIGWALFRFVQQVLPAGAYGIRTGPGTGRSDPGVDAYGGLRRGLGRVILLALELLVAADIIRTIAVAPTLENVAVLALIVLIRTFLSFALEVELNGALPWRRGRTSERDV